jgi:glycerophosphoryl diester phosphodiesterase
MSRVMPGGPARAIAHRGEPVGHRENTLPAVAAALGLGADLVEIDVQVTADGAVVLLHDATLERLWGEPVRVDAVTGAELARRTASGVPLLRDALALIAGTGTSLLIDMDSAAPAGPALQVVHEMIAAGALDPAEVAWCGALPALEAIRRDDETARLFLSWNARERPGDDVAAKLAPEAFNPQWTQVGADTVGWARERGMATCCWTVDDEDVMATLLDRGVDALISNRIGALRGVVDGRG